MAAHGGDSAAAGSSAGSMHTICGPLSTAHKIHPGRTNSQRSAGAEPLVPGTGLLAELAGTVRLLCAVGVENVLLGAQPA